MKKFRQFTTVLFLVLIISCSTNNDSNGNSNTNVVPVAPTNLLGTAVSTTQINLSWKDNSTNETSFKIERKTGSGTYAVIGTTATDVTTFSNTGLSPSTTYTYRVYANNAAGNSITCSNELILTTSATILLPTLTTTTASAITNTTAITGGTISSDGGAAVTAKGVIWSASANPTIALPTKTSNGAGIGAFISSIIGLTGNTTYYIRAYATNSIGTTYGNQLSFITNPTINLPTLTTTSVSLINTTSATSGGSILNDGGAMVTARGVVWSTSPNPTISLFTKTNDGNGTGMFTSNLAGLTANTTYYLRAYATNTVGTAYGVQLSFATAPVLNNTITDVDGNTYQIVTICTKTWTTSNLNVSKYRNGDIIPQVTDAAQWAALTTGAWCYYSNSSSNGTTYGKLYNLSAVKDPRGLAPVGWHIATYAEWTTLTCLGGGANVAGGHMKETGTSHWASPNVGATNSVGFASLPGGQREVDGSFNYIGTGGKWWSSGVSSSNDYAGVYGLVYNYADLIEYGSFFRKHGFSVRCVKD